MAQMKLPAKFLLPIFGPGTHSGRLKILMRLVSVQPNGNYFICGNHLMAYSKSKARLDKDWNNNRLQLSLKLSDIFFLLPNTKTQIFQVSCTQIFPGTFDVIK